MVAGSVTHESTPGTCPLCGLPGKLQTSAPSILKLTGPDAWLVVGMEIREGKAYFSPNVGSQVQAVLSACWWRQDCATEGLTQFMSHAYDCCSAGGSESLHPLGWVWYRSHAAAHGCDIPVG